MSFLFFFFIFILLGFALSHLLLSPLLHNTHIECCCPSDSIRALVLHSLYFASQFFLFLDRNDIHEMQQSHAIAITHRRIIVQLRQYWFYGFMMPFIFRTKLFSLYRSSETINATFSLPRHVYTYIIYTILWVSADRIVGASLFDALPPLIRMVQKRGKKSKRNIYCLRRLRW